MNSHHPALDSKLPTHAAAAVLLTVAGLMGAAPWATAQPTGNPAGTQRPPTEGTSSKPPASRAPSVAPHGSADSDEAVAPDSRAARSGNLGTPGVGSAGGLTGRHPGGPTTGNVPRTNQAPPAKQPKQQ